MKLKPREEKFFVIDAHDLNDFIHKTYPKMKYYQFHWAQKSQNDCSHTFKVQNNWDATDEPEQWEKMKNTKEDMHTDAYEYCNGMILNALCIEGYIQPGNYLIRVCW